MKNATSDFTLLICGQILSRVKDENYSELITWLKESRKNFGEIIRRELQKATKCTMLHM